MPKPNWAGGAQGAVSGGLQGFAAGGPIGAAIGATAGGVGGLYGGGGSSGRSGSRMAPTSGMGGLRPGNQRKSGGFFDFLTGSDPQSYQQTTLGPEQIPLYEQLVNAGLNPGAGGAFGTSADYYRNLLSNNPEDMNAFAAPEMRRFREDIVPGLAEQFAGMGAGGLSSSGFRNAAVGAGTDLAERLGAIRANLRQQGAQGLAGIGQQGLGQYLENIREPATPGLLQSAASGIGQGLTQMAGNYFQDKGGQNVSPVGGRSSPYGGSMPSNTPSFGGTTNNKFNLPTFMGR